jgi:hypothetical protein
MIVVCRQTSKIIFSGQGKSDGIGQGIDNVALYRLVD